MSLSVCQTVCDVSVCVSLSASLHISLLVTHLLSLPLSQISLLSTFALPLLMAGHMIQMRINQPSQGESEAEKGERLAIEALQSIRAVARNAFEEQLLRELVALAEK